jgi:FtsP/CotA-like multicopper oxidase with cupredoxin domain
MCDLGPHLLIEARSPTARRRGKAGARRKDTFNVPTKKTKSFVVRYEDRPGNWMFHCHILEHAELGMMGMLMLEP